MSETDPVSERVPTRRPSNYAAVLATRISLDYRPLHNAEPLGLARPRLPLPGRLWVSPGADLDFAYPCAGVVNHLLFEDHPYR